MRRKQEGDKFEALRSHPNFALLLLPPKPALTSDTVSNLMSLNFSLPFLFQCLFKLLCVKKVLPLKNIFISFGIENFCGRIESKPFPYLTFEVRTNRASGTALRKHDLG